MRPFHVNVPEEELVDLRRRIAATRWPDRETVTDRSQGVQLSKFQELVSYWGTSYDWRKVEAKLNALSQFVTTIDGVDIHFIHQACVARWSVETLSQIFEEDPHKHCADRETNYCQPICR